MRFWDASAIVPLLVEQQQTQFVASLVARDPMMLVWWGSRIECVSVLARLEREGALLGSDADAAYSRLDDLTESWNEIEATELVRESATRFLRVHPLRTADALQLAAAFTAAEGRPRTLEFLTFDARLADVARKEGFAPVDVA